MEHSGKYRSVCILVAACLMVMVAAPAPAAEGGTDYETTAEGMVVDLMVLRPLGLAATVLGVSVFFLTLPFTFAGRADHDAARKLVVEPATYTFTRPLGHPGR